MTTGGQIPIEKHYRSLLTCTSMSNKEQCHILTIWSLRCVSNMSHNTVLSLNIVLDYDTFLNWMKN